MISPSCGRITFCGSDITATFKYPSALLTTSRFSDEAKTVTVAVTSDCIEDEMEPRKTKSVTGSLMSKGVPDL